ncbi:hemerythrin domain-containing protein, partial [Streptomyces ipomoeae]|uniref:hemerythrin domain-containing protein n=1 Tax=Streptomyces ipomoeae TaxID=103232 RepID=UPI0029B0C492
GKATESTLQSHEQAFFQELVTLRHHPTRSGSELRSLFPFLADRHPELSPALTRLRDEHEHIAALVEALRQAVTTTENADPAAVLHEVERIIVDLEAHLAYEEEQLIPALEAGA